MLPVIDELAKASARSKEREGVHFLRAGKGAREERLKHGLMALITITMRLVDS